MAELKPALALKGVSKHFGGLRAIEDVNLELAPGERRGVLGPNGAGKSTLFHVISGVLPPTQGTVEMGGVDVTLLPVHRRIALGMGRTFQVTNLFANLTVQENLVLALQGLTPRKMVMLRNIDSFSAELKEVEESLEKWRMIEMRDRRVAELSYGQQRKLELLLAVSQKPSILLLDEPTEGLSPDETQNAVAAIEDLPRNIAILLIEHDMDVALQLCSMLTVMHLGRVLTTGPKEIVRADPRVQEIYLGDEVVH
jgi:branched-chain amino acid transport system ATP-binding protein